MPCSGCTLDPLILKPPAFSHLRPPTSKSHIEISHYLAIIVSFNLKCWFLAQLLLIHLKFIESMVRMC